MTERDKQIESLLTKVNEKKEVISKLEKEIKVKGFKTSKTLEFNNAKININTANIEGLTELIINLTLMQDYRNKVAERYPEIKVLEGKIGLYSYQDYIDDCILQYQIITLREEKKQLIAAEELLKSKYSEDKKDEIEINNLINNLKL